jgi:nitrogen fixation NifU-like protein
MFARFRTMAQSGECPACAEFAPLQPLAAVHAYPSRVKCATLPWHALIAALDGAGQATSEQQGGQP